MKPVVENHLLIDYKTEVENRGYADVCLSPDYVRLYEEKEKGVAKTFLFKSDYGEIEHSYIKRQIPIHIDGNTYYDITSAYGYGGPIVRQASDVDQLFKEYTAAFNEMCKNDHIVSAFYRFHIIESKLAREHFDGDLDYIGPNIVKDLTLPIKQHMHKSVGTSFRRAQKKGLHAEFDTSDKALDSFLKIYTETMQRNEASDYYYFDSSFLSDLCRRLEGHYVFSQAVIEGKVVSSYLTLLGTKHAFAFIGGTLAEYLAYDASTFLEYETMTWLKNRGLQNYILGGGMEGEDALFRFKKKFDKEGIHPYYIGKKIYDKAVYDQLVQARKQDVSLSRSDHYFPLYRR